MDGMVYQSKDKEAMELYAKLTPEEKQEIIALAQDLLTARE